MGKITKTITIQMPVTAAYKIVKDNEAQIYPHPLTKDLGAVPAASIEDIPNVRYVMELKQYGTTLKIFYDFKPGETYTEIIINIDYGRVLGKTAGELQMLYAVSFLKTAEMGYLAALEGGTADVPDVCKKCGKELSQEFAVCPFCGTPR